MEGARQMPQANLKLPPELKSWLQAEADRNMRSFNSECVFRLEQSRKAQEPAATGAEKGEGQNGCNRLALGHNPANR